MTCSMSVTLSGLRLRVWWVKLSVLVACFRVRRVSDTSSRVLQQVLGMRRACLLGWVSSWPQSACEIQSTNRC